MEVYQYAFCIPQNFATCGHDKAFIYLLFVYLHLFPPLLHVRQPSYRQSVAWPSHASRDRHIIAWPQASPQGLGREKGKVLKYPSVNFGPLAIARSLRNIFASDYTNQWCLSALGPGRSIEIISRKVSCSASNVLTAARLTKKANGLKSLFTYLVLKGKKEKL